MTLVPRPARSDGPKGIVQHTFRLAVMRKKQAGDWVRFV